MTQWEDEYTNEMYNRQSDLNKQIKPTTMTSIEWLIDQMFKQGYFDGNKPLTYTNLDHLQQQAKEMHKQEIIDAYNSGYDSSGESGKEYYESVIDKIKNQQQ